MEKKPIKIIIVSPLPPPIGGIAAWTQIYLDYAQKNKINVCHIDSSMPKNRIKNGKISIIAEIKRIIKIKKNLCTATKNCDKSTIVIHYNASCFTLGLLKDFIILCQSNNKILYQCHCDLETNINSNLSKIIFRMISKKVSAICVLNQSSYNVAIKYSKNVYKISNFVDEVFNQNKKINSKLENVCFVGNVIKSKGIIEYINASKKFKKIKFHIIGPLGKDICKNDLNLKNIIYHGQQTKNNVIKILKQMDAFILPSYTEGFPMSILEAMSCGLPIIATNVGSIKEIIGNKGVVIINKQSTDELCNAIAKISNYKKRVEMSKYNIKKIENEFTISVVFKQLLDIYEELN